MLIKDRNQKRASKKIKKEAQPGMKYVAPGMAFPKEPLDAQEPILHNQAEIESVQKEEMTKDELLECRPQNLSLSMRYQTQRMNRSMPKLYNQIL